MKKSVLILFAALLLGACGAPAGNNAPANNSTNSTNTNKAAANTANATAGDTAAAEAEVKKVMDATQAALSKNDADAMDKIYADNYMTVNQDGSVQTRAERLAFIRSGDVKYESFSYSDLKVRVNPEATGAIGISTLALKGTFKGKPMEGNYRVTGIYTKTKDGWKLAGSQTTKIEGGSEPAKPAANATNANK